MAGERVTFRKSGCQLVLDGCALPIGAVLFLGVAVLAAGGVMGPDPLVRLFGAVGFGFFGAMMALGAVTTVARGTDDRVAEIGPDGIWLPGMGWLPWSEVAEVRLDTIRGVGSGDAPVTVGYRRLGVTPADPAVRPGATELAGWAMARAYFAFVRRIAPRLRLGSDDVSPFSAGEPELSRTDADRLIAEAGRYVEVVDAAERRARERAPRWAGGAGPAPPSTELSAAEVAALDAGLAPGRAPRTRAVASGSGLVDSTMLGTAKPRGTFGPPPRSLISLVARLIPAAIPTLLAIGFPVAALSAGGGERIGWFLVLWDVVLATFIIAALLPFVGEVRRRREVAANPVSLEVGPDGIRIPPAGRVAWDHVAEIRTERAGFTTAFGDPPLERWRLVVVRASGSPLDRSSAVDSDRIDARFDDVLDLVRFYHPVTETG
ncbi:MAG: hypothetical protein AB1736_06270 [Chloroflexota bacterium]